MNIYKLKIYCNTKRFLRFTKQREEKNYQLKKNPEITEMLIFKNTKNEWFQFQFYIDLIEFFCISLHFKKMFLSIIIYDEKKI